MGYREIALEKAKKLTENGHAVILSVESSCDETAIAIVCEPGTGRKIAEGLGCETILCRVR